MLLARQLERNNLRIVHIGVRGQKSALKEERKKDVADKRLN